MNARGGWWKAIGGLAVTTVLVAASWLLFRGQGQIPPVTGVTATTMASPTATQEASISPTPTAVVTPAQTAQPEPTMPIPGLHDYAFGEPRVVLTSTNPIKVVEWLPDNHRLLLELGTGDPVLHNRIVTLDVETGEIVEYGRRPDIDIKPVWVEQYQGVAYSFLKLTEASELRFGRPGGQTIILDTDYFPVTVDPKTGRIFYQKLIQGTPLRAVDPIENAVPIIPFDTISLPMGIPLIDPGGEWLAVLGRTDLPVLDMERGEAHTYDFDPLPLKSWWGQPWWAKDGAWSPNGRTLALILAVTDNLLEIENRLAILDTDKSELYALDLPSQYLDEIDWTPMGRCLAVVGASLEEGEHINTLWLVDTTTGEYVQLQLLSPPAMLVPGWSVAWSGDGQKLALFGGIPGADAVFISEVMVTR